jgi:hypothetical protein
MTLSMSGLRRVIKKYILSLDNSSLRTSLRQFVPGQLLIKDKSHPQGQIIPGQLIPKAIVHGDELSRDKLSGDELSGDKLSKSSKY